MNQSNTFTDQFQDFLHDLVDGLFGNERQKDLSRYATDQGYYFVKRMYASNLDLDVKALSIFRKKKSKRIYNMMTKDVSSLNGRLGIFDYKIYGESGNSKRSTFFLMKSAFFSFPHFRIYPKKALERFGEFFILQDMFLDYHPEFNKKFSIDAKFREDINEIISHELADLLLEEKNLHLEGLGNYLIVYRKNKLCPPRLMSAFTSLGMNISQLLKNGKLT